MLLNGAESFGDRLGPGAPQQQRRLLAAQAAGGGRRGLAGALAVSGAVQVKGPKWYGKTATSLQQAASIVYLQDPDRSASYLALADAKPSALLEGPGPRQGKVK